MTTTYYAIRHKESGQLEGGPRGTSQAPHLYTTEGKARGQHGYSIRTGTREVVPVELTVPGATFVERLHQEYDQLMGRLTKLRAFLKTDQCLNLPDLDGRDLRDQETLMTSLASLLYRRLTRAQAA